MSDNNPKSPQRLLPPLTAAKFGEFADEKWKRQYHECERCGVNSWYLDENRPYSVLEDSDGVSLVTTPPSLKIVVMITCMNCGNIRLTSATLLRDWLASRAKE